MLHRIDKEEMGEGSMVGVGKPTNDSRNSESTSNVGNMVLSKNHFPQKHIFLRKLDFLVTFSIVCER